MKFPPYRYIHVLVKSTRSARHYLEKAGEKRGREEANSVGHHEKNMRTSNLLQNLILLNLIAC